MRLLLAELEHDLESVCCQVANEITWPVIGKLPFMMFETFATYRPLFNALEWDWGEDDEP